MTSGRFGQQRPAIDALRARTLSLSALSSTSGASGGGGSYWKLSGNTGTDSSTHFVGTTDAIDVVFKRNDSERASLVANGMTVTGDGSGYALDISNIGTSGSGIKITTQIANPHDGLIWYQGAKIVAQLHCDGSGDGQLDIRNNGAAAIQLAADSTESYILNGKFGLGTAAPNSVLDVVGDIEISSTGKGIIHTDGVTDGYVLRGDGTRYVPGQVTIGDVSDIFDATIPTGLTPDNGGSAGSGSTAARIDHEHNVPAAAPSTVQVQGNTEGTNGSFARSDHLHNVSTAVVGGISPDDGAAEGTATSLARSDHTHSISCEAASTISASTTNSEGTNGSFARSDHLHTVTNSTGQTASTLVATDANSGITVKRLAVGSGSAVPGTDGYAYIDARLGIGVSPSNALHIASPGAGVDVVKIAESDGGQLIEMTEDAGGNARIDLFDAANAIDVSLSTSGDSFFNGGNLGIGTQTPDYLLDVAGDAGFDEYLYHNGDADTYLRYQANQITLATGGTDMVDITTTVTFGGNLYMPEYLYHVGDTDTYIRYQADQITMRAGGVDLIDAVEGATDYVKFPTYVGINATPGGNVRLDVAGYIRGQSALILGGTNQTEAGDGIVLFDTEAAATCGLEYMAQESTAYVKRYVLLFDTTDDASYPYLTNRTPSGAVAIFTGDAAGGGENEHFRIKGGDGTVDAYFTAVQLGVGTDSPSVNLHVYTSATSNDDAYIKIETDDTGEHASLLIDRAADTQRATTIYQTAGVTDWTAGLLYNSGATNDDYHIGTGLDVTSAIITVTTGGRLGIGTTGPDYALDVAGNAGFNEYLYHNGDANTYLRYQADQITLRTGGVDMVDIVEGATDYITLGGAALVVPTAYQAGLANDGSKAYIEWIDDTTDEINLVNCNVGINTDSPSYTLDVAGNAAFTEYLYHKGDIDTHIRFTTDTLYLQGGAAVGGDTSSVSLGGDEIVLSPGASTVLTLTEGATDYANFNTGLVFLNETSCGDTTQGLVINQGANDDGIIVLKSSDIAHGMTDDYETDTYGYIDKSSATAGGLRLQGITESAVGMTLISRITNDNTDKDSSAFGAVSIFVSKKSTNSALGNVNGSQNLLSIFARESGSNRTQAIFAADGDLYLDTAVNENNWDDYDDLALLHGFRASITPSLQKRFGQFIEYARPVLESSGIVHYNDDGHHFVAQKKLQMLTIDTVRQLYELFRSFESHTESRLSRLEARL